MANTNLYNHDNAAFRQFVGQTLMGIKQEIAALNDLSADNIRLGATILGYTGTYTQENALVAADASDIAEGKVAYVNGQKIIGVAGIANYALTVAADGTGAGAVTVGGDAYVAPVDYKAGAEVELVATPAEGSNFVKWTVGAETVSTEATFTYTMPKGATTITATFDLA
jgi:hypothetical protein